MCDKCKELDKKIDHFRLISWSITDQLTIDRINEAITKYEAQKAALHPDEKK